VDTLEAIFNENNGYCAHFSLTVRSIFFISFFTVLIAVFHIKVLLVIHFTNKNYNLLIFNIFLYLHLYIKNQKKCFAFLFIS
ncbi:hypothetical protein ACFMJT_20795, partial [Acinetobacter baumannii]